MLEAIFVANLVAIYQTIRFRKSGVVAGKDNRQTLNKLGLVFVVFLGGIPAGAIYYFGLRRVDPNKAIFAAKTTCVYVILLIIVLAIQKL